MKNENLPFVAALMLAGCMIGGKSRMDKARAEFCNPERVTLINTFEVPQGSENAAIQSWEASREFLAAQPGYIRTTLHQVIDPNGKFQLINVAQWASAEQFKAAVEKMRRELPNTLPDGTQINPALYKVIRADNVPPFAQKMCKNY